jgi:hypothetical protein
MIYYVDDEMRLDWFMDALEALGILTKEEERAYYDTYPRDYAINLKEKRS